MRETDAHGVETAHNIDKVFICIRVLNSSKDPAICAVRVQPRKPRYRLAIKQALEQQSNLTHSQYTPAEFVACDDQGWGLALLNGLAYSAGSVVANGRTCLNGVVHIGQTARMAGRAEQARSRSIANRAIAAAG